MKQLASCLAEITTGMGSSQSEGQLGPSSSSAGGPPTSFLFLSFLSPKKRQSRPRANDCLLDSAHSYFLFLRPSTALSCAKLLSILMRWMPAEPRRREITNDCSALLCTSFSLCILFLCCALAFREGRQFVSSDTRYSTTVARADRALG